jgi:hypothetical protein
LEERAVVYTQLSKFEKIKCIKQVITDWDGRFFILQPDGKCSMVRDVSPSSKLYTSVRRMMNYVVKKSENNSSRVATQQKRKPGDRKTKKTTNSYSLFKNPTIVRFETLGGRTDEEMVAEWSQMEQPNVNTIRNLERAAICTLMSLATPIKKNANGFRKNKDITHEGSVDC